MKKQFSETFKSGTFKAQVTSVVLVNNTQKTINESVPTDTKWLLESIKAVNADNVDRTVTVTLFKEAAKTNRIGILYSTTVTPSGHLVVPNNVASSAYLNLFNGYPMGAGYTLEIVWAAGGASAGSTDADGLVIAFRELPLT